MLAALEVLQNLFRFTEFFVTYLRTSESAGFIPPMVSFAQWKKYHCHVRTPVSKLTLCVHCVFGEHMNMYEYEAVNNLVSRLPVFDHSVFA